MLPSNKKNSMRVSTQSLYFVFNGKYAGCLAGKRLRASG